MAGASGGEPSTNTPSVSQMFGESTHTISMPAQVREKKAALFEVIELQRSFVCCCAQKPSVSILSVFRAATLS